MSFDQVAEDIEKLDDLSISPEFVSSEGRGVDPNDDPGWDVVNLQHIQFTDAGTIQVPGFGLLKMNEWSKRQLGTLLGVRWDKFFGNTPPDLINRSVTDHLSSQGQPVLRKVIARSYVDEDNIEADGELRGLVSPTYSEITDSRLLNRTKRVLGASRLQEMSFAKYRTTIYGTHLSLVYNEKVDMVGAGKSDLKDGEMAYYGLSIRNSEVGAYSLTGDAFFLRIICSNGLIVGTKGQRWLHRRHRFIDDYDLEELLEEVFLDKLPNSRNQIVANNRELHQIGIDDPEREIRNFLARKQQPKSVQEAAIEAFRQEPINTAYGVLHGITRLAMASRHDPDRQHDLEFVAGSYLNEAVREAA